MNNNLNSAYGNTNFVEVPQINNNQKNNNYQNKSIPEYLNLQSYDN